MVERPILFNGEMVRAILEGRKTQTRRVMKPQPPDWHWWADTPTEVALAAVYYPGECGCSGCPYGVPGDRLWVRETWGAVSPDIDREYALEESTIEYRADLVPGCTDYPGEWPADEARGNPDAPKWRPSIHMPRRASRINLEVTGVRIERVQDISEEDAQAEGCYPTFALDYPELATPDSWTYRAGYAVRWDSINAKRDFSWESNPWVWVVDFKILEPEPVQ